MITSWDTLQQQYPWPDSRPRIEDHWKSTGWMSPGTAEMLQTRIKPNSTVLELGSWLGKSARFILEQCCASRIVCIDAWDGRGVPENAIGEPDILPHLYDVFVFRMWNLRERIIPIREEVNFGLWQCYNAKFQPDFVYIDASHDEQSVRNDVSKSLSLFPKATLIGDDWGMDGVRIAITKIAELGYPMEQNGRAWCISRG